MVSKGAFRIYTTGQLERVTGITERTISYYNSLGLLSLEKKHGKKMVTDDDLNLLVEIFIMKITRKRLKDIRNIVLEQKRPFSELLRDLENMNDQIINILVRLKQFDKIIINEGESMQDIERQAQKKGVSLKDCGRCQFCGSNTKSGVFECFDVFNDMASNFVNGIGLSQFIFADAHCLQHSEVHGIWNNNLHLTRQYLILEKNIEWEYSKTTQLSNIMDQYKLSHPDVLIPTLPVQERGHLTVTDLIGFKQKELELMILKWANDVYESYDRFHPIAKVVGDLYINKYER